MASAAAAAPPVTPAVLAQLHDADLAKLPPDQQQVHIFQWLRTLERQVADAEAPALKAAQPETEKRFVHVLTQHKPMRPVRELLARCWTTLYARGDARGLHDAVSLCQAQLRAASAKDAKKDAPLQPRLYVQHSPASARLVKG